jgi:hypothetical protein
VDLGTHSDFQDILHQRIRETPGVRLGDRDSQERSRRESVVYDNNTFTWSGSSGVGGCTGQARVARLGHAPERATDHDNNNTFTWSGPSGVIGRIGQRRLAPAAEWCMPITHCRCDGCHAVPLNAAESGVVRKPPRRKKITTQV